MIFGVMKDWLNGYCLGILNYARRWRVSGC
jgi:hypothetical protein